MAGKRRRLDDARGGVAGGATSGYENARIRAIKASIAAKKNYPYNEYGRMYVPKSTSTNVMYGPSWAKANKQQRDNRRENNYHGVGMYTGRGMYNPFKSRFGRAIRHAAASELGSMADGIIPGSGRFVKGGLKAAGIGMYTGPGMYTGSGGYGLVQNELISGANARSGIMRFDQQSDVDSIVLTHTEYVMDVYSAAVANGKADILLRLNPGNALLAPQLAQIAGDFEYCRIEQMALTYKPTLSDWQTSSGQVGTIMIATQYNAAAQEWSTKEQMLAQTGSTSGKVTDIHQHGIECDPSKLPKGNEKYIRTGPPPVEGNKDITDYDLGFTQIRIQDCPDANKTLGELHISYKVTLMRPRIHSHLARNLQRSLWQLPPLEGGAGYTSAFDATSEYCLPTANAFKAGLLYGQQNMIDCKVEIGPPQTTSLHGSPPECIRITFPAQLAGDFRVKLRIRGKDVFALGQGASSDVLFVDRQVLGNVERILDMLDGNVNTDQKVDGAIGYHDHVSSMHFAKGATGGTGTTDAELFSETHLRMTVASSGVDNVLELAPVWVFGGSQTPAIESMQIELEAYNCALNYAQNGSNDLPILETAAKQVITQVAK